MAKPVAMIFGAGQNIGASLSQMLRGKGYRVASISRSGGQKNDQDTLSLAYDLSKPNNVSSIFQKVRESWGEPSVVVYTAAAVHFTDGKKPFEITLEDFEQDLAINITSVFATLKETIASFEKTAGTFVLVGNCLNEAPMVEAGLLTLGVGKSGSAYMVGNADKASAAGGKKSRFHYVDQRNEQGAPMSQVDGPAHAEIIEQLIEGKVANAPSIVTFVKGQGHKSFPRRS